ncbi:MAG: cell filamentation protein Fic [Boseongicola sp. SB0675_bin_26]|nr:cell filamentation protein Fic [Boseongicola sp. SB0675_bin_26]
MQIFEKMGFSWNRAAVPAGRGTSVERATFRHKQSIAEFVYDAGALEGNPFTYPEVQTLLEGITVGGRKLADQQQIHNLGEAANKLFRLVHDGEFRVEKPVSDELHRLVAKGEALDPGHFRGEGDPLNLTVWPSGYLGREERHWPLPTKEGAPDLNRVYVEGVEALASEVSNALERGMAYFLFGALQQFHFDGNKRTSRFMMNGILMSHGVDAISIPAARLQDFNEKMVRFCTGKDATEMMRFLIECQPKSAP